MLKNSTIRSLGALIMLLVFALGITPKMLLHDLVTNHRHIAVPGDATGNDQLIKNSFTCDCDNLVASSPFTGQTRSIEFTVPLPYISFSSPLPGHIPVQVTLQKELRGPPSAG